MPAHFTSGFSTVPMWHGLGNILDAPPLTIQEAMVAGGMNWDVLEVPNMYLDPLGNVNLSPGWKSLIRSDNNKLLSIQSDSWTVVQNSAAFGFFEPFMRDGSITLETGVCLKEGRQIALTGKINSAIGDVVKGDPVEGYLVVYNAHDGTLCFGVTFTNTRVVCANTLAIVVNQAKSLKQTHDMVVGQKTVKLRHTASIHDNIDQIRNIINIQKATFDASLYEYILMSKVQLSASDVTRIYGRVFELDADADVSEHRHYEQVLKSFESGIGMDIPGVSGTGWGLYNAFTEFTTHHRASRGEDETEKARGKFSALYFGESAKMNERAHSEILAMA